MAAQARRPDGAALRASGPMPLVATLTLLLAACAPASSPTPEPSRPSATAAATTPSPAQPTATPSPTAATRGTPPPPAADPPVLRLAPVADGLQRPIGIVAGEEGRLYVHEQGGRILVVEPDGSLTTFGDLADRLASGGERGLLGLALHPAWPAEPRLWAHYSGPDGATTIAELAAVAGGCAGCPPQLNPASERVILRIPQPFANHNGGQLAFGPDGYLWIGLGDGGGGGDPEANGQDPTTPLGGLLRIDVSAPPTDAAPYAIPADNPFASGGGAPELQVIGLRNPWRFSFDRATGDLWIADVGQGSWEEVTRLAPSETAGANLGWAIREGAHCFVDDACPTAGLVDPITEYGRDLGRTIIGGYVYRGEAVPSAWGWYLFADIASGLLFGIPSDAATLTTPRVLLETGLPIASFGEGADGELYVATLDGGIYRVVAG